MMTKGTQPRHGSHREGKALEESMFGSVQGMPVAPPGQALVARCKDCGKAYILNFPPLNTVPVEAVCPACGSSKAFTATYLKDLPASILAMSAPEQSIAIPLHRLLQATASTFYPESREGHETREAMRAHHLAAQADALKSYPGAADDLITAMSMTIIQLQSVIRGAKGRIAVLIEKADQPEDRRHGIQ